MFGGTIRKDTEWLLFAGNMKKLHFWYHHSDHVFDLVKARSAQTYILLTVP